MFAFAVLGLVFGQGLDIAFAQASCLDEQLTDTLLELTCCDMYKPKAIPANIGEYPSLTRM